MTLLLPDESPRITKRTSPASMLRTAAEAVPFHGREAELNSLAEWCESPGWFRVQLIVGPGGAGKTRLVQELIRLCRSRGWHGGFLAPDAFAESQDGMAVLRRTQRLVVAVDYAETRLVQLDRLLALAERASAAPPLRLLLIARGTGDLWDELKGRVREFADATVMSLVPLYPDPRSRTAAFNLAVHAFASKLQGTAGAEAWPSSAERVSPPDDLSDDKYEHPLVLQTAALLALVESVAVRPEADSRLSLTAIGAAAEVYRDRVQQGHRELVPELLDVLRRQAEFLTARGSQRAALSAVEEAVALVRDEDAAVPNLPQTRAEVLTSYAAVLSALNRRGQALDAAQEAVSIYRRLSASDPEAGLPGLARSLHELSVAWAALGGRAESLDVAMELVTVYRDLDATRPGLYQTDLALALSTQSSALAETGRREEALAAATEAVRRYRASSNAESPVLAGLLNSLAARLTEVGNRHEALNVSEEAVALRERLAADDPAIHGPELASSLNNLALALGDVGRLEEAVQRATETVRWYQAAAAANPDAYLPQLAASLNNLGVALTRVGRLAEATNLGAEALRLYRTLAQDNPTAYASDLANSLNNLSNVYAGIGENQTALELIQEAVDISAGLADANPAAFLAGYAASLSNLASALSSAGRHHEARSAADQAVAVNRDLARANTAFEPQLAAALNNLGVVQSGSDGWASATESLREAVAIRRALVLANSAYVPDLAQSLENLARAHKDSGNAEEALNAISEAVRHFRGLAEENASFKADLARASMAFAELCADGTDAMAALEEAVAAGRAALAASSGRTQEDAKLYANLAIVLYRLSEVGNNMPLLDEAVDAARQAAAVATAEDLARARYISRLALMLLARYVRSGEEPLLAEATAAARAAVAATADDNPAQAQHRAILALVLTAGFGRSGEGALLDEALDALDVTNPDGARSEQFEDLQSLSKMLSFYRSWSAGPEWFHAPVELGTMPAFDVRQRRWHSAALGGVLLRLYEHAGDSAILSDAVTAAQAAVAESPGDDPSRAAYLANLSTVLLAEYDQTGAVSKQDDAVEAARGAVAATPTGHSDRARYLDYLRIALMSRYERTRDLEALDEAVSVARDVVAATVAGHTSSGRAWAELGDALLTRFDNAGNARDVAEAVNCFRSAVSSTPEGHPHRARFLIELGSTLVAQYRFDSDAESAHEALAVFTAAAGVASASAATRLLASRSRGDLAAELGEWGDALVGYTEAVELLPRVFVGTHEVRRSEFLRQILGLPQDAAAVAVREGRPELAAQILEQGRGVLLSLLLDAGGVFGALKQREPAIASRMHRLVSELTILDDPFSDDESADRPDSVSRRPSATIPAEWDDLVQLVRKLPGFEEFLRAPSIEVLTEAASGGPVVMLNVSRHRCDAIILQSSGVSCVPLPDLTYDDVLAKVETYRHAIEGVPLDSPITRRAAESDLRDIFSWLWRVLAAPVLAQLGYLSPPPENTSLPRLWWCPTGLLAQMPIHAAGFDHESVLDLVVSSYAPTVLALKAARERPQRRRASTQPIGLIVGVTSRPDMAQLPGGRRESTLIADLIPRSNVLSDEEATRARILEAVTACDWLHFVGYSAPNASGAGSPGLFAFDAPVTFSDLAALRLDHADLAFLSTNQTARRDPEAYDETVHIASGFAVAGFKHVIGTLWGIEDQLAVRVAVKFYDNLLQHGLNFDFAAHALHQTVRRLRQARPSTPSVWATYIHIGP